jgi:hypothetical protein
MEILPFLGWKFKKDKKDDVGEFMSPFIVPTNDDVALTINNTSGGDLGGGLGSSYNRTIDFAINFTDEYNLVRQYRDMAIMPEVNEAITEIVNEAVNGDNTSEVVSLNLDKLSYSDDLKTGIQREFDTIINLLDFNSNAYETFRKWYIDGKIHYYIVIDPNNSTNGIQEVRYLSPFSVKKVREVKQRIDGRGIPMIESIEEYYLYSENKQFNGFSPQKTAFTKNAIKLTTDSVATANSGLIDEETNMIYSYLHVAIKPSNILRCMENALVIYRLSRAPERRVFYVDVGGLPKNQSNDMISNYVKQYKNALNFDTNTGKITESRNILSMMEDIFLPRREGSRGTEITTLPGGQNLGDIEDVDYFKEHLYRSLNVPYSRIKSDAGGIFNTGGVGEITRDEAKFSKFISRLRKKFSGLFMDLLKTQLLLKGYIDEYEWMQIKSKISIEFKGDMYFAELKENEMWKGRLSSARDAMDFVGKYYSHNDIRRRVLKQSEEEIRQQDEEIRSELDNTQYYPELLQQENNGEKTDTTPSDGEDEEPFVDYGK